MRDDHHPRGETLLSALPVFGRTVGLRAWTEPDIPRQHALSADAFLGDVSWSFSCEATHWPSLGIVVRDDSRWGQGIGHEALGLWTDLLFAVHGFHRADLRTWSGNLGMCALALKLGFVEEARFREARPVDGVRYDSVAYGMLRRDWAKRWPRGFST